MSPLSGDQPADATPSSSSDQPDEAVLADHVGNFSLTKIEESSTVTTVELFVEQEERPDVHPAVVSRRPGRPPRTTEAPATWSIRGVSRDTRKVFEQGAEKAGKTLGQYINEDVRAMVEQQLADNPVTLQAEIQYLRRLVENLTTMVAGTTTGEAEEAATE